LASKRSTWTSRCWYIASSAADADGRRRDRRVAQRLQHLAAREVLAQALGERLGRHAERRQRVAVDAAVGIAQRRVLRVALEGAIEAIVGHRQVQLVGGDQGQAVADDAVERHGAHLGRLEHLRVEVGHLAPGAVDALAHRVVELACVTAGRRPSRRVCWSLPAKRL
jgi:hypothetical protein